MSGTDLDRSLGYSIGYSRDRLIVHPLWERHSSGDSLWSTRASAFGLRNWPGSGKGTRFARNVAAPVNLVQVDLASASGIIRGGLGASAAFARKAFRRAQIPACHDVPLLDALHRRISILEIAHEQGFPIWRRRNERNWY